MRNRNPHSPFSLRLSAEERALLESRAGQRPLGEYLRSLALGEHAAKRLKQAPKTTPDRQALSQILDRLGRSRIANNLNQLARAANIGALILTEDDRAALLEACADIREIRRLLLKALGLKKDI